MEVNIVKKLGVLSERTYRDKTTTKEVNIVSWNGRPPKVEIREWSGEFAGKGVTLTDEETERLYMILHNYITERKE